MPRRTTLSPHARQARSRLTKVLHTQPMLRAGLVTMSRTCGKAGCKCAKGQKHVSLYLAVRVGKARKMVYIPPEWEEDIRAWVGNYREAAELLDKILQGYLERFLSGKKEGRSALRQRGRKEAL